MFEVGQKVLVTSRNHEYVATVDKITKTGLVLVKGTYYYPDGRERGGDVWNRSHIHEFTEEDKKVIEDFDLFLHTTRLILRKYGEVIFTENESYSEIIDEEDIDILEEKMEKFCNLIRSGNCFIK